MKRIFQTHANFDLQYMQPTRDSWVEGTGVLMFLYTFYTSVKWPVNYFVFITQRCLCELLWRFIMLYFTKVNNFYLWTKCKKDNLLLKEIEMLCTWCLVLFITWLCGHIHITVYVICPDMCTKKRNISMKCVKAPLNSTYHLRQL